MPEPAGAGAGAGAKAVRRFLTFRSGAGHYALAAEEVAEIIILPPVSRLPQSPAALLGMANLRGSVIAVASLQGLLGQAATGAAGERGILLSGASPVAISVDHIESLVSIDEKRVETRQAELAASTGERLLGAFQSAPEAHVTKILDIQTLLADAFKAGVRSPRKTGRVLQNRAQSETTEAQIMLISFEIGGQEYALPLQDVLEIAPLPESMAGVPRSEALLLGIVSLREKLLPLLSLRGLLGFPLLEIQPDTAKIIVTSVAGVPAGLVADRAKAIISAPAETVQPAPPMLAVRMGGESRIRSIYRDDAGRIIPILAVESLFGEEVMTRLSRLSQPHAAPQASPKLSGQVRQFLVFQLGEEAFGLPVAAVDEVAAAPDKFTRLPRTPKFLEGVINWRGEVLPIINQRRRFDMPEDASLKRRLLVVRTQRHRAGLLVDGISGVVSAADDQIEAAPHLAGETISLVNGVLNLAASSRIILLLNPEELLSRTERGLLDEFANRQKLTA